MLINVYFKPTLEQYQFDVETDVELISHITDIINIPSQNLICIAEVVSNNYIKSIFKKSIFKKSIFKKSDKKIYLWNCQDISDNARKLKTLLFDNNFIIKLYCRPINGGDVIALGIAVVFCAVVAGIALFIFIAITSPNKTPYQKNTKNRNYNKRNQRNYNKRNQRNYNIYTRSSNSHHKSPNYSNNNSYYPSNTYDNNNSNYHVNNNFGVSSPSHVNDSNFGIPNY